MNALELTYSQLGKIVYKKKEITKQSITDIGVRYWLLKNLSWVLTFPWQGIRLDNRKHIDIRLWIGEKNGKNQTNKYFVCKPTTSDFEFHLKMEDGKTYVVHSCPQFSVVTDFDERKACNTIEYQSMPKYESKGPIRPNPFHN